MVISRVKFSVKGKVVYAETVKGREISRSDVDALKAFICDKVEGELAFIEIRESGVSIDPMVYQYARQVLPQGALLGCRHAPRAEDEAAQATQGLAWPGAHARRQPAIPSNSQPASRQPPPMGVTGPTGIGPSWRIVVIPNR